MPSILIEPWDSNEFGPCECCGNMSRTVWGSASVNDVATTVYYVQWTLNQPKHGAFFDLIIGNWGDDASAKTRLAISLLCRFADNDAQFMVIDANDRFEKGDLVANILTREDVVGTPIAKQAFALVDAIWEQDTRIAELRDW